VREKPRQYQKVSSFPQFIAFTSFPLTEIAIVIYPGYTLDT